MLNINHRCPISLPDCTEDHFKCKFKIQKPRFKYFAAQPKQIVRRNQVCQKQPEMVLVPNVYKMARNVNIKIWFPGGSLCDSDRIDAIFNTDDGDYFVFQGSQYWKLTEESVAPGYPRYQLHQNVLIAGSNRHFILLSARIILELC